MTAATPKKCTGQCGSQGVHCGRCGVCSGWQGCYTSMCNLTTDDIPGEFHFCCPDDCELAARIAEEGTQT